MLQSTWGMEDRKLHHFCLQIRGRHSKMSRGQVATQHGGFPGRSHGGFRTSLHGVGEISQILRSCCWFPELASTRLSLCLSLLLLVYVDFFFTKILFIRSLAVSTVLGCLLCPPVDGFSSGWWKSATISCKSTVYVARQLRLRSESQTIGHHNLRQLTNPSLSNLPMHRLISKQYPGV